MSDEGKGTGPEGWQAPWPEDEGPRSMEQAIAHILERINSPGFLSQRVEGSSDYDFTDNLPRNDNTEELTPSDEHHSGESTMTQEDPQILTADNGHLKKDE